MKLQFDIVIVGAGPAGLAAAQAAASAGGSVAVLDDNPQAGGQIWRGGPQHSGDARAAQLWTRPEPGANERERAFFQQRAGAAAIGPRRVAGRNPGRRIHAALPAS